MIPFDVTIPESERDKNLLQKLQKEKDGILAWLVKGAVLYYEEGLKKTDAVENATKGYKEEMDLVGNFLEDCIQESEGSFLRSVDLYHAYLGWCSVNGVDAIKQNALSRQMTARNISPIRTPKARGYINITLTETGTELIQGEEFPPNEHTILPFCGTAPRKAYIP